MKLITVNKRINELGINLELVKGKDYFYFVGDDLDDSESSMVLVMRLNDLPLVEWIKEAREKSLSSK